MGVGIENKLNIFREKKIVGGNWLEILEIDTNFVKKIDFSFWCVSEVPKKIGS